MPPHRGHAALIEFAGAYANSLTVVVGSLKSEPIAGELRYQWMKQLYPSLNIVHLTDENPQLPDQHPDFWNIWRCSLQRVCSEPIDLLFASEDYGRKLAAVLGAEFVPMNGGRVGVPVSGTDIRRDPWRHWDMIPAPVQRYYARQVVFVGPESSGKTTLSRALARELGASWVPEYARTYLDGREDRFSLDDMERIARGQWAANRSALLAGRPLTLCDTDAMTTALWCEELFDEVPDSVRALATQDTDALTLLLSPDVPWESGPLRLKPETRERFFDRCHKKLEQLGRKFLVISGSWESRVEAAREAILQLRP